MRLRSSEIHKQLDLSAELYRYGVDAFRGGTSVRRLVPAVAVAALLAWLLWSWIIDDAAISYSYARNVARGDGLVAQAGNTPVEGFSNPLWVVVLASAAILTGSDAHLALKCCSGFFTLAYLSAASRSTAKRGMSNVAGGALLLVLALQPPLAIWSNSGLEVPLLLFCLIVLAEFLVAMLLNPSVSGATIAGIAAASCALTRPEGVVYFLAGIVLLGTAGPIGASERLRAHLAYATTSSFIIVSYTAFRYLYFDDWLPNTFYAKGGITFERFAETIFLSADPQAKGLELGQAVGGAAGAAAMWSLFGALFAVGVARRALSAWSRVYFVMTGGAVLSYILLPTDWMGEYRYGAPAILLAWMSVAHICHDLCPSNSGHYRVPLAVSSCVAIASAAGLLWVPRIVDFRASPALPLQEVVSRAISFEEVARILEVENPSILTQDAGGFLLRDRLQLHDLGMLTDRRVARAIGEWRRTPDHDDLHSYVFDEVRPTFISTVAYHAWRASLAMDPRFARDYRPIRISTDRWVLDRYGVDMESGDYVRKSAVRSDDQIVRARNVLMAAYSPPE